MIDPDYYLFTDISITEIEGPAEFFDWEAEERNSCYDDHDYWKIVAALHEQDAIDSAEADDLGDVLVELELPHELLNW